MKKIIATVLSGLMLASLLGACGSGGDKPTESSAAEAPETTANAEETEKEPAAAGGETAEYVDGLGEVKADKEYNIGFTISARDQFLSAMEDAAVKECEKTGVKMTVVDANNNANTQIQNVQTFASQGCDAIIVNLVNSDNMDQIEAAAGDIPLIYVNRAPNGEIEAGKGTYVGSDENQSGRFQGEFLAEKFKAEGKSEINVAVLQGILGLQHTLLRTESALKALDASGLKVNVVYEDTAEFDRSKAQNKMQTFLGTGQAFDAVICNNDEMALGAIEAMKSGGVDPKEIPVVGIDATPAGLQSMENGELAFTVFQNAAGQGEGAVRAAILFANGNAPDTKIDIPFEPVTPDNYTEYK